MPQVVDRSEQEVVEPYPLESHGEKYWEDGGQESIHHKAKPKVRHA